MTDRREAWRRRSRGRRCERSAPFPPNDWTGLSGDYGAGPMAKARRLTAA